MRRLLTTGLTLALLCLLVAAHVAVAQDGGRDRTPTELWDRYPLGDTTEATPPPDDNQDRGETTQEQEPPPAQQPAQPPPPASESDSDGGGIGAGLIVAAIAALILLVLALMTLARRRSRPAPATGQSEPEPEPAPAADATAQPEAVEQEVKEPEKAEAEPEPLEREAEKPAAAAATAAAAAGKADKADKAERMRPRDQRRRERALARQEKEKVEAERAEAERVAREKAAAEKAEAERVAREKAAAEKAEATRAAQEKAEAERVARERAAQEKAEADRAAAAAAAAERAARDKAAAEKAEAERAAREKAEAERTAAERAAQEKAAAEQAEAERAAQSQPEVEPGTERGESDRDGVYATPDSAGSPPQRIPAVPAPAAGVNGDRSEPTPESPSRTTALGYTTVAESDEANSPRLREEARKIQVACEERGLELGKLVRDLEPESGSDLERPGLAYAIDSFAKGEFSCLVVTRLDRLTRSAANLGTLVKMLKEHEVRLIVIDIDLDTATREGRLAAASLATVGGLERQKLQQRTRKGLEAAREHRRASGRPAVSDKPTLKQRIADMRASGMTLQAIADTLNDEGVPTMRGGAQWRPSSVQAAAGYKRPKRPSGPRSR